MRSGRLRHRLQLQSKTESRTASGASTFTWTTDSTVWGGIEPLSGKEYVAASQVQNEEKVRIVIRYHASIDETWRVVNGGKYYSIHSVINSNERNRDLILMCSQGVKEEQAADDTQFYVVNSGTSVVNSGIQVVST